MIILGYDPGGTTGIAALDTDDMNIRFMAMHKGMSPHSMFLDVTSRVNYYSPDAVVVEDFILRRGQNVDITPAFLIGAVESACPWSVRVKPSEHKSVVKDALLNKMIKAQNYEIGAGHSRDALRLCVYWAVKQRIPEALELLRGEK